MLVLQKLLAGSRRKCKDCGKREEKLYGGRCRDCIYEVGNIGGGGE